MPLPTNPQGGIDLTSLRLEAARNAGVVAEFTRRTGRQFTGSIADYGNLNQGEQLAVSAAMARIVKARPADFQPVIVKRLGGLDAPIQAQPGVLASLGAGAMEGLVSYPKTVAAVVGAVGAGAGSVVSKTFTAASGGQTIGGTINRALLIAGGVAVLYLLVSSGQLGKLIPTFKRGRK